ncbi:MAG: hypothetical protein CL677_10245 [Bdellovibrionaceae bacterium]|nr:hypothetical protein [Pseudobdellovibrionaceae bacterium]|tara:strand:+ start:165782 stop:166225 length:444 start_codon:yes stop_codon:yes gene_type:complete
MKNLIVLLMVGLLAGCTWTVDPSSSSFDDFDFDDQESMVSNYGNGEVCALFVVNIDEASTTIRGASSRLKYSEERNRCFEKEEFLESAGIFARNHTAEEMENMIRFEKSEDSPVAVDPLLPETGMSLHSLKPKTLYICSGPCALKRF